MKKEIAPAVKLETKRVAIATGIMTILMWIVFGIGHALSPQQIPFNYTVILGGLAGGIVAVANFFLMGLTVQQVASTTDEDLAKSKMKASYSQRFLLQVVWIILAIVLPCFQFAAGILPLLFPSLSIKLRTMGMLPFGKKAQ